MQDLSQVKKISPFSFSFSSSLVTYYETFQVKTGKKDINM